MVFMNYGDGEVAQRDDNHLFVFALHVTQMDTTNHVRENTRHTIDNQPCHKDARTSS